MPFSGEPFETIDEAFAKARHRLPRAVYSRIIGTSIDGLDGLTTENVRVFNDVLLVPRAAAPHDKRNLQTSALGTEISLPVILSAVGGARIYHVSGEPAVAAAAHRAGTIDIAAMAHGHTIEEVRLASGGPLWQQIRWSLGREAVEEVVERASASRYEALVVTIDMPFNPRPWPGHDVGAPPVSIPPGAPSTLPMGLSRPLNREVVRRYGLQGLVHPRWACAYLLDAYRQRNVPDVDYRTVAYGATAARLKRGYAYASEKASPDWKDLKWLRQIWNGSLVLKGIGNADDARRAVDVGANAVAVSNHGGLGLSGIAPALMSLPRVVKAVDGQCEVYLDSGVRRGSDVVKALCLGARATLIGRPYVAGLAAAGGPGVGQVIEILRREIEITLGLLGCESVQALDRTWAEIPMSWTS